MFKKLQLLYLLISSLTLPAQFLPESTNMNIEMNQEGFINVQDATIFYKSIGKGIPVIVLHGGPGLSHDYFFPSFHEIAKDNFVVFYDQRGAGKSLHTALDDKHININQFVQDLDELRKSLSIDQFILIGHSWGGLFAMQYAVDHAEQLLGLVLLNTAPANEKGQKAFIEEFHKRTKDIHDDIQPFFTFEKFKELTSEEINDVYRKLFSTYMFDAASSKNLHLNLTKESAQSGFKVMEEMSKTYWLQPHVDLFPMLKELKIPTFLLHGKQDIVPAWTAEEIKNTIPHAEIIVLDNCGHFPHVEQPALFFTELNKCLQKINALQNHIE